MARRKARTPEARENQLINLAYDLAEQQIRDGTISATVLANFVKMGSQRERMEREKLQTENEHLHAKIKAMESMEDLRVLYQDAMSAMSMYNGESADDNPDIF